MESDYGTEKIDWPVFMQQHDMIFDKIPESWKEAPHFGNAMIGYFLLHPKGKLTDCNWRKDLWNAELTGTITTDKGEIEIRHFTHAEDVAIVTELTPSEGEKGFNWTWHPFKAETSRGGYPTNAKERKEFIEKYGDHYAKTLKPFKPNPEGFKEERGNVSIWLQNLLMGGQYATAWGETENGNTRTQIVSVAKSYPESTAAEKAANDVKRFMTLNRKGWSNSHTWWISRQTKTAFDWGVRQHLHPDTAIFQTC
jgi:hypothetical protein